MLGSPAMNATALNLALAACLALCACGRADPLPSPDVLKTQREAMDKAKATEKVLQEAAERRDTQLESQQK
jgi:predicted small lipoprotein YifL